VQNETGKNWMFPHPAIALSGFNGDANIPWVNLAWQINIKVDLRKPVGIIGDVFHLIRIDLASRSGDHSLRDTTEECDGDLNPQLSDVISDAAVSLSTQNGGSIRVAVSPPSCLPTWRKRLRSSPSRPDRAKTCKHPANRHSPLSDLLKDRYRRRMTKQKTAI